MRLTSIFLRELTEMEIDLFDNVYELVDSLTYKTRTISPSMWPVFEITYKLFKSEAVDFLEGTLDLRFAPSLD